MPQTCLWKHPLCNTIISRETLETSEILQGESGREGKEREQGLLLEYLLVILPLRPQFPHLQDGDKNLPCRIALD